jgi:hypothetical protein
MQNNGRSRLREKAVVALLQETTIERAPQVTGVGLRTLQRWLNDATFQEALRKAKADALADATAKLRMASGRAVRVLDEVANNAEANSPLLSRHPINRFKPVDQDAYVAFDTATGQLCRSYRSEAPKSTTMPAPASSLSPQAQSHSVDPILSMIERGNPMPKHKRKPKLSSFAGFLLARTFAKRKQNAS